MGLFDTLAALFGGGAAPAPGPARVLAGAVPVRLEHAGANKIATIKVVREATGLGLKESKDLVESAPVDIGVATGADAIALVTALQAAGARASLDGRPAPAVRAGGEAWVALRSAGPNKILVIKAIREATGLGLAESKSLADEPSRIGPLSEERALTLLMALTDAHADASIG